MIPALEHSARKKAGAGFEVCFQPEFLREGSSVEDFFHPSRTVIGVARPRGREICATLAADQGAPGS